MDWTRGQKASLILSTLQVKLRLDYVGLLNTLNIKNEHQPGSFNTVVPQIRNTYQRIRDATYVELSNVVYNNSQYSQIRRDLELLVSLIPDPGVWWCDGGTVVNTVVLCVKTLSENWLDRMSVRCVTYLLLLLSLVYF